MATLMYDSEEDDYGYNSRRDRRRERRWTKFEVDTLLALICKGAHKKESLSLASELNTALNGSGRGFGNDIPVEDVEAMMDRIRAEKKGALAFIERQPVSVITRKQREVFHRNFDYLGTKEEWEAGRKSRLQEARALQQRRHLSHMGSQELQGLPGWSDVGMACPCAPCGSRRK